MVKGTNSQSRKVITPAEAKQQTSGQVDAYLDKVVPELEDKLRNTMAATLDLEKVPDLIRDGVIKALKDLFEEAGWSTRRNKGYDQRDGDSWDQFQIYHTEQRSDK